MIYDHIVIGAGMAGVSAAYELAAQGSVLVVEAEAQPGYHSTGRSAALFTRNYGPPLVRKINAISAPFFEQPPGFVDRPLLHPRGALAIAPPGAEHEVEDIVTASTESDPVIDIAPAEALEMIPFLRPERVARAAYEPGVTDIEVAMLFHAYLKAVKHRDGEVVLRAPVQALIHANDVWTVRTKTADYRAKTIVNASGAWADRIGALAGAMPIGLVAKRRTAIIVDAPVGVNVPRLPAVDFLETQAYLKPDAGKIMASPGDETPLPPQDVQPDEMDIALLVDLLQRETTLEIRRIAHSWAGFRSFVADDCPVVGFDPTLRNFVWLAGQGGYGIMMAPSLARVVASLCQNTALPNDFAQAGIGIADLSPERLRTPQVTHV